MSDSTLASQYNPRDVEPEVWRQWEAADAFHADPAAPGDPYSIVIPPPNVTAALHLGHALNNTLQDVLVRWRRMAGDNAIWLPGTDHAGIATQTVVDKRLKTEGQPALAEHKQMEARGENGREKFIEKVQAWKDEYEKVITNQLKTMGCSCDWKRQAFTMDEIRARAVREAFFQLFKDGLIYRGKRLVNWDPATQTALADDEVEMHTIDGHFWYMKYPLVSDEATERRSDEEFVTVATTRPETMLGDTAVAVNPNDPVRAHLIGRHVRLPIVNRVIPIIDDDYVVMPDPESSDEKAKFASGFLKVTPAHDPNDYEIGQRHDLPIINVMAPDGSISKDHGWPVEEWGRAGHDEFLESLLGMDRYEAREAIVDWFRTNDLLEEVKPYTHSVGHSYRSHVPVEPYLSDQWYLKVTDQRLAGAALRAMAEDQRSAGQCAWSDEHPFERAGSSARPDAGAGAGAGPARCEKALRFTPDRYARTFQTWHENIRDWCISRQLWWGHRIPVWRYRYSDETIKNLRLATRGEGREFRWRSQEITPEDDRATTVVNKCIDRFGRDFYHRAFIQEDGAGNWVITDQESFDGCHHACFRTECPEGQQMLEAAGWEQDPDVLDTWFSSALWPMSTLGWPDDTAELKTWNPTSVLSTAREIITLWVSRMVMFNLYFRGCVPFGDVFIHAMIQDGEGRKMSKSLGNGVDPLDIIHSHGADAMRFTLAMMTTQTQDVRMPVQRDPDTGRNTSPKFDIGRNFANKLWNATRFALGNLSDAATQRRSDEGATAELTLEDRWILSRAARTIAAVDAALSGYEFHHYGQAMYQFVWNDLCDWYIEVTKPRLRDADAGPTRRVLASVIDLTLRLLHPSMPFVTEKLWAALNNAVPDRGVVGLACAPSELLARAAWPVADGSLIDEPAEQQFERLQTLVTMVREVRASTNTPPRETVEVSVKLAGDLAGSLEPHVPMFESLARVKVVAIGPDAARADGAAAVVRPLGELYLHRRLDVGAERDRLTKRLAELRKNAAALSGRLNNTGYVEKAPAHLVQETREQLAAVEAEIQAVQQNLDAL